MRGVKERSVLVIFVSEQAKLAASHLSPYLSQLACAHRLCSLSIGLVAHLDANHTILSSCPVVFQAL